MTILKRSASMVSALVMMISSAGAYNCSAEGTTVNNSNTNNTREIVIDGTTAQLKENMRYRGAGMVSANNSSRLLLDYKAEHPDVYEQIMEYMFGKEGIGITHLKLEMGADINSSSGTEPSVMRTEDEKVRDFIEENIRVRFIGDRTRLSENLQRKMASVEEDSKDFDSMTLVLAINYGGRDEICHAAKTLAQQVKEGKLEPEDITMDMIERNLYTEEIPPVDLVIRPSGEQRLSNFMIWQAAYAEFYYTNILWPDFKGSDLDKAVIAYSERNRRFGGV